MLGARADIGDADLKSLLAGITHILVSAAGSRQSISTHSSPLNSLALEL